MSSRVGNITLQLQHLDRRDVPHSRHQIYDVQLHSNFLTKGRFGLTLNCSQTKENLTVRISSNHAGEETIHELLLLSLLKSSEKSLRSVLKLNVGNKQIWITGNSLLEAKRLQSAFKLTTESILRGWNFSLDSWKHIELLGTDATHFLHQFNWETSGLTLKNRLYFRDGLINMNQTARIGLSPPTLSAQASSRKGVVWLVGKSQGSEKLLELKHNSSAVTDQRDAVFRLYIDSENMLYTTLHWRPNFLTEAIIRGTELSLKQNTEQLLETTFQPIVNFIAEIFDQLYDYSVSTAVDWNSITSFKTVFVEELQTMFNTLKNWHEKDTFYLKTVNIPFLVKLSEFNVTEIEKNITSVLQGSFEVCRQVRNAIFSPTRWLVDCFDDMQKDLVDRQLVSVKHSIAAILRETNQTILMADAVRYKVFGFVAAPLKALGTAQKTILEWMEEFGSKFFTNSISPLTDILRELGGYLLGNIRMLDSMGSYCNYWLQTIQRVVKFFFLKVNKLAFGSSSKVTWTRLIQLLTRNQTEEVYQTLFHPERYQFKADLNKGISQFAIYVPTFFKDLFSRTTVMQSMTYKMLSMLVPKDGMKSLMYLYDQYQRNFDVLGTLVNWVPPYEASGWLLLGPEQYAHLVTLNGLYVPIPRNIASTYLLIKDWLLNSIKIVQFIGVDEWRTRMYFGDIVASVDHEGKVIIHKEENSFPQALPYTISRSNFTMSFQRVADRITVFGRHVHLSGSLFAIQFDIGLQQIQFTLGGYWHGRCSGLLGSHSFDQIDELKGLQQQPVPIMNISSYNWRYQQLPEAKSLEVNYKTFQEILHNTTENSSALTTKLCLQHLKKLSSCYEKITIQPWYAACRAFVHHQTITPTMEEDQINASKNETISVEQKHSEHVCRIIRALTQFCNQKRVTVRVPNACIICDGSLKADGLSRVSVSETPASRGHVLFVLQLDQCLTERREEIAQLIYALERDPSKPMEFSAFVFDGNSGVNGVSWLTSSDGIVSNMSGSALLRTLDSVLANFNSLGSSRSMSTTPVLDAVLSAIHRPSPATATHMALLLYTCGECTASKLSMYGPVHRLLERKGIEFHYLPHTSYKTASDSSGTAFLLQGDDIVYEVTGAMVNNLSNTGTVIPPRDQCTIIAQKSNGYIWAYKDTTSALSRRSIAVTMAKILKRPVDIHKECHCRDNRFGQGILDCSASKRVAIGGQFPARIADAV